VRSSPRARRDGAKRSGLTAPRTAEQSHVVMAVPVRLRCSARERTRRTRRARLGNGQEMTADAVSGGDSAEVRVHLYERSFPEEPDTRARAVNANDVRTALDTGAAFAGVTGIAPSRRVIVTCMWGVSDPLRAGRGAKKGAANWGSLTPRLPWRSTATVARRAMPAAQSAAGVSPEAADWQEHERSFPCERRAPRALGAPGCQVERWERCSRVSVPPSCSPFGGSVVSNQEREKGRHDTRTAGATEDRPTAVEAAL
jgi:hypothetical protein